MVRRALNAQAQIHDRASVRKFHCPLKRLAERMRNAENGQVWFSLFFITAPNYPRTLCLRLAILQKYQPNDLILVHAMSCGQKIAPLVNGRRRPTIERIRESEGICA